VFSYKHQTLSSSKEIAWRAISQIGSEAGLGFNPGEIKSSWENKPGKLISH